MRVFRLSYLIFAVSAAAAAAAKGPYEGCIYESYRHDVHIGNGV
jgi:hypothetical protein